MRTVPVWFYIIAALALLWNVMGAAAVIMNFMISPEDIAMLGPEQQQMYVDTPSWSSYASLLAVLAGSLGCIALLMKKAWAYLAFIVSLLGLIIQDIGIFIVVDAISVMGVEVLIMQTIVFVIALALIWLAKRAIIKEWIS